jgi:uncharacterized membrane protein
LGLLLHTLLFRWYVFLFWGTGLLILSRAAGSSGAVFRYGLAYAIAYACEYSSSRPGGWFPFGYYEYLPTTLKEEVWIGPLPLMDSLSFAFLMVASLGTVAWVEGRELGDLLSAPIRKCWTSLCLVVVFFVAVDVVIDPSSLRGSRWFLGQIYDYPGGGMYFGVPVSNFIGWGVVGILILAGWRTFPFSPISGPSEKKTLFDRFGPVALYFSVYLFNLGIAIWIGERGLALADLGVGAILAFLGLARRRVLYSARMGGSLR